MRRRKRIIVESRIPFREDLRLVEVRDDRYDVLNFIIDMSMFLITGGLWVVWIFIREMRRR